MHPKKLVWFEVVRFFFTNIKFEHFLHKHSPTYMSFLSLEIKSIKKSKTTNKHNLKVRLQRAYFSQLAVDWSSCPWSLEILSRAGFKESAQKKNSIFEALANFLFCFSVVPNLRNKAVFLYYPFWLEWINFIVTCTEDIPYILNNYKRKYI